MSVDKLRIGSTESLKRIGSKDVFAKRKSYKTPKGCKRGIALGSRGMIYNTPFVTHYTQESKGKTKYRNILDIHYHNDKHADPLYGWETERKLHKFTSALKVEP